MLLQVSGINNTWMRQEALSFPRGAQFGLSLFRTALRLYERPAPAGKLDALRALTRHISFDPQPFLTVEELKDGRRGLRGIDMPALFGRYWMAVETVTDAVDRLIRTPS